jgi:hypothetical protein
MQQSTTRRKEKKLMLQGNLKKSEGYDPVRYRYLGATITFSYVLSEQLRGSPKYTGALLYRYPMYYQSTSRVLLNTQEHAIKS